MKLVLQTLKLDLVQFKTLSEPGNKNMFVFAKGVQPEAALYSGPVLLAYRVCLPKSILL